MKARSRFLRHLKHFASTFCRNCINFIFLSRPYLTGSQYHLHMHHMTLFLMCALFERIKLVSFCFVFLNYEIDNMLIIKLNNSKVYRTKHECVFPSPICASTITFSSLECAFRFSLFIHCVYVCSRGHTWFLDFVSCLERLYLKL